MIGAGPAGTIAAATLNAAGLDVLVLERASFPRFVIGESMLPRMMDILAELDLVDLINSRGYIQKAGAVFTRGDETSTFDFADQHTEGAWDYTWQVPRADFDKTLADAVAARGVDIRYGHTVMSATLGDGLVGDRPVGDRPVVKYTDENGAAHTARPRFVVDASGYGRVLPRMLNLEAPSDLPPRSAIFTHVVGDKRPAGPEEGRIWVFILAPELWLWVIPFSDGKTSVGAVGSLEAFEGLPPDPWDALHQLTGQNAIAKERLNAATPVFQTQRINRFSCNVTQLHGPGYCLVGNATEFLDPVFSSGVMLAVESGHRAAGLVVRQLNGETIDWDEEYSRYIQAGVDVFRTYVEAWYDGRLPTIFFAPDPDPAIKRQVCSVLAGYVWDETNPFVTGHTRRLTSLARLLAKKTR